ncbi:restriction endonuclease subunit S [Vibrio splendidus]|nr:restriction endonuclease subunit S [Vibrio splendidus]MCC4878642.1 restriction endonuclease subunit S [Vibrio splendidus]
MGSEWNKQLLGSLCHEITVGFVGSMTQEYVPTGVPFLRSKNIAEYDIDWNDMKYVSKEFHSKLSKSVLKPGDVAIVRTGKPGTTCVVPADLVEANCSDIVIARVNAKLLNPHYLAYFMNAMAHGQVNAHVVGAVQQHFNVGSAKKIEIPLPSILEQEKVVNVLKALDDKFKLNNQINQTLEQMAQAIFKSWFVDFDPVKTKMNGEQPKGMDAPFLSKTVASLFPEKLVESELGLIPEGWEVTNVGDFTDTFDYVANGSFAALKANVDLFDEPNEVIYVRTTDFNKGFKNELKYTDEPSYQFLSKSKLYGHETIISNVGDVGTVFRAPSWYDMPMTLGSNAMGIVSEGANSYIYYMFKSHIGQHLLDGITSGSAQMKFNKTSFRKLRVVLPSKGVLAKFEELEASLWAKHASNQKESLHLEKLRDTLLPKLLSGEIDLENLPVEQAKALAE